MVKKKPCWLIGLRGGWGKYSGIDRPAFGMECLSKRQVDKRKKDPFYTRMGKHPYSYQKANCKIVQKHWNFHKKYASYGEDHMNKLFRIAKRLCGRLNA